MNDPAVSEAAVPELRRDPVIGRWVIISPTRSQRPVTARASAVEELASVCPFCPGNEAETPPPLATIEDESGRWRKRVFLSKAPVVNQAAELIREGEGMFDMMSGYGVHEVIVDSPDHAATLATMSDDDLAELAILWRDRFRVLKRNPQFRYLMLFANRGTASGATIGHSHSQIIATPTIPRRLTEEIAHSYAYFQARERCVFCDLIEADMADGARIIHDNGDFVVLAPYASRFPCEMWILPRDHASHFEEADERRLRDFAEALRTALKSLHGALNDPPYSFVLHTAPLAEKRMVHYHWHLEIMPRLTNVAGFEWGTGFYINSMAPEEAARLLRQPPAEAGK